MTTATTTAPTADDLVTNLVTVETAAAYYGVNRVTIYRWIESGILPAVRLGPRCIRLRRTDLQALGQPIAAGGGTHDA